MSDEEPKVGDEVAWNWGSSHIEGQVVEKTDKKLTKKIKGKLITKNGEKDNPAYFIKQTKKKGSCLCKLTKVLGVEPLARLHLWKAHISGMGLTIHVCR